MADVQPVYLIKGDDPSLVRARADELQKELAPEGSLAVDALPEDADITAVVTACATPAFLTERRVIVVQGAGRFRADELETLAIYLQDPMPTSSLLMVAGGGTLSPKLTKMVKAHGHVVDASTPASREMRQWITNRLKTLGIRVNPAGVELLVQHLGGNLGAFDSTMEAVVAAHGTDRLGPSELQPYLGSKGAPAPWDLTDAIAASDVTRSLRELALLLEVGERHPVAVLASLGKYIGNLARTQGAGQKSDAEWGQLLGMAPYPAKKVASHAQQLGAAGVRRAQILCAQAELDVKGMSAIPSRYVLEVFVARLCRLGRTRRPRGSAGSRQTIGA